MTNTAQPTLIVIMGVSGSGKTTLAKALASELDINLVEADDFHSEDAIARMRSGEPLTDEMRGPWMQRLTAHLRDRAGKGKSCVLAWSGLRRAHRASIAALPFHTRFFLLQGKFGLLETRLKERPGHFMPASLLSSQMDALETPAPEENIHILDCACDRKELLGMVIWNVAECATPRSRL